MANKCYEIFDAKDKKRVAEFIFAENMFHSERIAVRDFRMVLPICRRVRVQKSNMKASTLNGCLG